jgi:hypothetical protein
MASNSGQTSPKVLKDAGMLMAKTDYGLDVWLQADPQKARKVIKSMAASLVNQAPNRVKKELLAKAAAEKKAAAKAEKAERAKPIESYDDRGFDPRDGGKVGEQSPKDGEA